MSQLLRLVAMSALLLSAGAQNLSDAQVAAVVSNLASSAQHSWEIGTRAQALLELNSPSLSVVTESATVPPPSVNSTVNDTISDVLTIARDAVAALPSGFASNSSGFPLVNGDGAAGDPASIGVAVLLANWTGLQSGDYAGAATAQMRYLLNSVPKTSDGAISHRVSEVQLWSDSVFMVPPFLAYYGVTTNNKTMVGEAYNQIKLYRKYLRASSGAWQHILLGSSNDTGLWSTGNGWAAAGMLRVYGTIQNSHFSGSFKNELKDLSNWVLEIQGAMYKNITSNNLFRNYNDNPNDFEDASSTALMAATVYRLSLLAGRHTHLPAAEKSRLALFASNSSSSDRAESSSSRAESASPSATAPASATSASTSSVAAATASAASSAFSGSSGVQHFTSDGFLTPVVDPENWSAEGSNSPEGEAFVLMLQSAHRDWVAAGSVGANAATMVGVSGSLVAVIAALVGALLVL